MTQMLTFKYRLINSNCRRRQQSQERTHHQQHHDTSFWSKVRSMSGTGIVLFSILLVLAFQVLLTDALECQINSDCNNADKICHDNKCICVRDKPIEDGNRCLKLLLIGEGCSTTDQCLGNSQCLEGVCSCGQGISIYNPSTKIYYCHPRRNLKEICSHDLQCPPNAYCSLERFGCLCQNGYAPLGESQCLPKSCTNTTECESEFHRCYEQKCMCLPGHFDLVKAECYRYGSNGGSGDNPNGYEATSIWIIVLLLIIVTLFILTLIGLLLKRHYKYCWTHTKEYEPNNKDPKVPAFQNTNTINKSFRRKKDTEDYQYSQQQESSQNSVDTRIKSPLMSSTSTPV